MIGSYRQAPTCRLGVEPPIGIEPMTYILQVCCSTTELRRRGTRYSLTLRVDDPFGDHRARSGTAASAAVTGNGCVRRPGRRPGPFVGDRHSSTSITRCDRTAVVGVVGVRRPSLRPGSGIRSAMLLSGFTT